MSWWDVYGPAACVLSFGGGWLLAVSFCMAHIKHQRRAAGEYGTGTDD